VAGPLEFPAVTLDGRAAPDRHPAPQTLLTAFLQSLKFNRIIGPAARVAEPASRVNRRFRSHGIT
jgi:hypothetical protein